VATSRLSRSETKELTRRRLLDAGRAAFASRGFDGANLSAIQGAAGVSVGSFYHQFRDKTDLFLAVLGEISLEIQRMIRDLRETRPGVDLPELARRAFSVTLEFAEQNPDLFRIFLRERASADPQVRRYLDDEYQRFVRELTDAFGHVARARGYPDVDFELGAELVSGMTLFAIAQHLEEPDEAVRAARRPRLLEGLARMAVGGLLGMPVAMDDRPHSSNGAGDAAGRDKESAS